MSAPYHFARDGKTDDGNELRRFLVDDRQPIAALPTGTYRLLSGTVEGPGSLGVLSPGMTYILNADGSITLRVP